MSADKRIRVMVVDDHPVVRDGLRNALVYSDEFDVVGQAVNGTEAVGLAEDLRPDVIIMDVIMPEKDGVDACREIVDLLPDTPVLMLTTSTEDEAVIESIAAGATGYLLKDTGLVELLETVREVAAGCLHIPVQYLRRAFRTMRAGSQPASQRSVDALTSRERETLALLPRSPRLDHQRNHLVRGPGVLRTDPGLSIRPSAPGTGPPGSGGAERSPLSFRPTSNGETTEPAGCSSTGAKPIRPARSRRCSSPAGP